MISKNIIPFTLLLVLIRGAIKIVNLATHAKFSSIIDWLNSTTIILFLTILLLSLFSKKVRSLSTQYFVTIFLFLSLLTIYPYQLGYLFHTSLFLPALINHANASFWWENIPANASILLVLEALVFCFALATFFKKYFIRQREVRLANFAMLIFFPLVNSYGTYYLVQKASGEFLDTRLSNLEFHSIEKVYKKENQLIRLIPMMHIARNDFFQSIIESIPEKDVISNLKPIVISEGVNDERLLLKSKSNYSKAAALFGLSSQKDILDFSKVPYVQNINGDIDVKNFSPSTIEFLNWVFRFYDSIGNASALLGLDLKKGQVSDDVLFQVFHDILTLRDESLWKTIEKNLPDSSYIIVPWGALHLPYVEKMLIQNGFTLDKKLSRIILKVLLH